MEKRRKLIIGSTVALIVILALVALGIALTSLFTSPGVKTEALDASNAKPATTDVNGHWSVVHGSHPNISAAGFTFHEVLPAEERTTSGSTTEVSGDLSVRNGELTAGRVVVNMESVSTDTEKRDISVRRRIFETDKFPEAYFEADPGTKLDGIADDGQVDTITVPGTLTIHGVSKPVRPEFQVVRDGEKLIVSTTIPVRRQDYGVNSPEFVAAKIANDGEVNVLLTLEK